MEQGGFRPAERAQHSILAKIEKKSLIWLAERMPRWVTSDQLTLLGFVAMLAVGLSYALARYDRALLLLAVFGLAANWLGDSLDGTLARVRNRQRHRYGFYVDHMVDTFSALFLLGGLAASGYMSLAPAAGVLIAYYILSIETYLATYTIGRFHLSFAGFGPTELRILIAIGTLWLYFRTGMPTVHVFGSEQKLFDVGGAIALPAMLLLAIVAAVRHTRELYRAEPIP